MNSWPEEENPEGQEVISGCPAWQIKTGERGRGVTAKGLLRQSYPSRCQAPQYRAEGVPAPSCSHLLAGQGRCLRSLGQGQLQGQMPTGEWDHLGVTVCSSPSSPGPPAAGTASRSAVPGPDQAKANGLLGPRNGPTLFQVQEQLGHAGGRVLLPALGLRRGAALRQPVAVGRVARGPPQRLQGFWLSFAPLGGGRLTCGQLTLRGLRGGRVQQRWAWRELLLVPMEEGRASCTPGPQSVCQTGRRY